MSGKLFLIGETPWRFELKCWISHFLNGKDTVAGLKVKEIQNLLVWLELFMVKTNP